MAADTRPICERYKTHFDAAPVKTDSKVSEEISYETRVDPSKVWDEKLIGVYISAFPLAARQCGIPAEHTDYSYMIRIGDEYVALTRSGIKELIEILVGVV